MLRQSFPSPWVYKRPVGISSTEGDSLICVAPRAAIYGWVYWLGAGAGRTRTASISDAGGPASSSQTPFDRAAQLEPLSNGTEPELRVWAAPFLGNTGGYAISSERALVCGTSYRNDGLTASVEQGHCAVSDMPAEKRRSALDLLSELSALNGRSWGCALGGETYFVEGFVNRRRFALLVSNPLDCKDSASLLVTRFDGPDTATGVSSGGQQKRSQCKTTRSLLAARAGLRPTLRLAA